ncbi:MAG: hypothetical protein LBP92_01600 [Deltaproteobacteria bacterium]|nr:hypothetical protein [Deltaproteobacteria bacterium]
MQTPSFLNEGSVNYKDWLGRPGKANGWQIFNAKPAHWIIGCFDIQVNSGSGRPPGQKRQNLSSQASFLAIFGIVIA